jgi:HSP20 family molecular chaperone IbpA
MKHERLPDNGESSQGKIPELHRPQALWSQVFKSFEQWLHPDRLPGPWEQLSPQVKVEESDDAYEISVFLKGVEQPGDIEATYARGHLRLRRTVQKEAKNVHEKGSVWQSYYEHFEKIIPLEKPIRWHDRHVSAGKGVWTIRIPKR